MTAKRRSGRGGVLFTTLRWVALTVLTLGLAGCGGDDDPVAPAGPGNNNTGAGTMTALIDGVAWTAVATTGVNQSGIVAIGGSNLGGVLGIGLGFAGTMADTYLIGPGHIGNGNVTSLAGSGWVASGGNGNGTINVTSLTATRIIGTFSFTAPATVAGTTPAVRVVTQGTFDVPFN